MKYDVSFVIEKFSLRSTFFLLATRALPFPLDIVIIIGWSLKDVSSQSIKVHIEVVLRMKFLLKPTKMFFVRQTKRILFSKHFVGD